MAGLRVLFDPCLAPQMGAPGVVSEVTAPPPAGRIGRVDVVCVTSGDFGAFDAATVAALDVGGARFLVPDDAVRKRLAHLGHRRVRVVDPGDVVGFGDVVVTASPAAAVFGNGRGFHLDGGGGATLWHTGSVPPLEVDAQSTSFAADHPARVVCAHASGLALTSSGPPLFADLDDGVALARIARARAVLPIARGARPAGLFSLVLTTSPPTTTPSFADLEIVEPVPSTWYRFG